MTEDEKVIAEMTDAGIVAALAWAASSAHSRAWSDFDPETGHNQTVLGVAAHTLLADRQDRVFRVAKYSAADDGQDQDLLLAGLLPAERSSLPAVSGVERADLHHSPAWQYLGFRWFLSSFEHGRVHDIAWSRKSPTKRKIAAQTDGDSLDQFVLPGTYDSPIGLELHQLTLGELLQADTRSSVLDLVLAHSVDPHTGATELFLGRPRLNVGGGRPWVWLRSLVDDDSAGSVVRPDATGPERSVEMPEAPVRLRPHLADGEPGGQSVGR
ncbi:hypothetical protein AB0J82_05725 [Asanoa sp. NPDC049518]|uniref:hypothetical protein n=1 Tax=unclassified Asanoa TaxID=2685164 RepID=UPI00342A8ADD